MADDPRSSVPAAPISALRRWPRRHVLATVPTLAALLDGCSRPSLLGTPPPTPVATPLPPRPGDPDEVRFGVFVAVGYPAPPISPLEQAATDRSGTASVGGLRLRAVRLQTPHDLVDPDTHLVPNALPPAKVLSAQLLSLRPADWPDLVAVTNLDQLRDSARRALLLPLDRHVNGLAPAIADPWPGAEQVGHYRGHLWGVPVAERPLVLTYQPLAFRARGANYYWRHPAIPLPTDDWTWDDLVRVATLLTPPSSPNGNPLINAGPSPDQTHGTFGFFATAPDSLPVFVWQAGGEVITGQGRSASCALEQPAALAGQRFVFDLIHKNQVSPRQTPDGHWSGSAVMQLGPASGTDFVLPPKGKVAATGFSLASATVLAVTARARDPERAARAALGLAAAVQGQYDWPVSQAAMERRAQGDGPAATALAALRLVHPPGLVADVRDAVESAAIAIANQIVRPEAATLDDANLVNAEAASACAAVDQALKALP